MEKKSSNPKRASENNPSKETGGEDKDIEDKQKLILKEMKRENSLKLKPIEE